VYSRAEKNVFDLWTANPDGSEEVRLSDIDESPAGEDYPRWSPDGTRVVFETTGSSEPPRITLWTVSAEGGEPTILAKDIGVRGGTPDWSPDGRCIVFGGAPNPADPSTFGTSDLWLACDGESPERLTDTPMLNEQEATWHPDGNRLAFVARTADPEDRTSCWQLLELTIDGGQVRPLLDLPEGQCARFPRWSHSGDLLALIVTNHIGFDFGTLHVLDYGTAALTPLVTKPSGPFAWAPDDSGLLFNNISLSGVNVAPNADVAPIDDLAATGSSGSIDLDDAIAESDPRTARTSRALQEFGIGLYRIEIDGRRLTRLRDKPGGTTCTSDRCFEFGYAPDWTAGTYTPTPPTTPTPPPPTATLTPEPTLTPTATLTPEATPTSAAPPAIYLPRLYRNDGPAEETPEATAEATAEASPEATPEASPQP
jgi:dipeptidyl aminopeptidase/acylaminoacyl peptidase